jgi:uncharacterized membrane-anchored protein YitT (DUF2179 family)
VAEKLKASIFFDYLLITIGTLIIAFAIVFFLSPNMIAPGGVTGLAIVIKKIAGIPIDLTNLVINTPLFILGLMILGKKFGAKTAYGTITLSLFIRIIMTILGENIVGTSDLLLASLYGGVILGIGIGIVFKAGGTTGGTDLAGAILNKYIPSLSIPKLMMCIDLTIVISAGIVNGKLETALYSVITLYIIVKMADFVIEGLNYAKAFFIISNDAQKIGQVIMKDLDRGATILQGRGMYTGKDKDVILCIVDRSQVTKLKNIVNGIDRHAFMMVTTIHEVLGEGFKK